MQKEKDRQGAKQNLNRKKTQNNEKNKAMATKQTASI